MIETLHLFPQLKTHLIELLKSLDAHDWAKPTCIQGRTVKDIASHILDASCIRRLSNQRDNYSGETPPIASYSDLVNYIQKINADWILASRRMSPRVLISILETMEDQVYNFLKTLEPDEEAMWPVAWAGEDKSFNWFDIARDYTEKWHHQMQIRDAVVKPGLFERKYVVPVYETFMKALPFTFRNIQADNNSLISVSIEGQCGGQWFLYRNQDTWELSNGERGDTISEIRIKDCIAWKLFTNSIRKDKKSYLEIKGDLKVGQTIADMVTVLS